MGASSDQLEQQIADVRGSMESKIVELRERSRTTVRRASRTAVIAIGAAAAVGIAVGAAFILYRVTRPPTVGERFERVVPPTWWNNLRHLRNSFELGLRKTLPPVRLYVGDQQLGEQPPSSSMEKIVIRAAQAFGTAAAAAIVTRMAQRLSGRK